MAARAPAKAKEEATVAMAAEATVAVTVAGAAAEAMLAAAQQQRPCGAFAGLLLLVDDHADERGDELQLETLLGRPLVDVLHLVLEDRRKPLELRLAGLGEEDVRGNPDGDELVVGVARVVLGRHPIRRRRRVERRKLAGRVAKSNKLHLLVHLARGEQEDVVQRDCACWCGRRRRFRFGRGVRCGGVRGREDGALVVARVGVLVEKGVQCRLPNGLALLLGGDTRLDHVCGLGHVVVIRLGLAGVLARITVAVLAAVVVRLLCAATRDGLAALGAPAALLSSSSSSSEDGTAGGILAPSSSESESPW